MIQDSRIKQFGFSLVELLVVVAIVLVLTGIGSYSINQFTQSSKVLKLRDYVSSQIKLAKNLSVTNQLPNKSVDLAYVRVSVLDNKIIAQGVDINGVGTSETPYFSENLDVSGGTSIRITNNLSEVNSFGFLGKTGRLTDGDGVLSEGTVVVQFTNGGEEYSLTINDLGIISNDN